MTDLEFIKCFSKIKISSICEKLNIDKSNLWAGRVSSEKIKQVKDEIVKEFNQLEKANVEKR